MAQVIGMLLKEHQSDSSLGLLFGQWEEEPSLIIHGGNVRLDVVILDPPHGEMCVTVEVLMTRLNDLWRHKHLRLPSMCGCKFKLFAYVSLNPVSIIWNTDIETDLVHSTLQEIGN